MRKLLFFDIDGTILSEGEKRYIPDSAVEAVHKLQQNGHLCFRLQALPQAESIQALPTALRSAPGRNSQAESVYLPCCTQGRQLRGDVCGQL